MPRTTRFPKRRLLSAAALLLTAFTLATACTTSTNSPPTTSTDSAPPPLAVTPGIPPPPGPTDAPAVGVNTLEPVPPATPADFGNGLTATVTRIDSIQVEAHGPGEIAGPGVSVGVELRNGTDSAIDLNGVVVNASYGAGIPASPNDSPPAERLSGQLAIGDTAQGVYVFQVPESETGSLVVQIDWNGSPNVVLIRR